MKEWRASIMWPSTVLAVICFGSTSFGQFHLDIEAVADSAFPAEEEAETPQKRNRVIRGRGINFKANMEQWMFQPHGSESKARSVHRTQLNLAMDMTERDVNLTQEQKEKLRLAGEGDIARYFAQFDKIRAEFADVDENADGNDALNRLMRRIQPFRQQAQASIFSTGSLFKAVSDKVLDPDQRTKLRKAEEERLKYYFGAALKTSIAKAERASPLKTAQRNKILAIANEMEPPLANNRRYMKFYAMYRLAQKKGELKEILNAKQFAAMSTLLQQGDRMERTLKSAGMIE